MKIHKLNLKEIIDVYVLLEPYIEKDKHIFDILAELLADGKGTRLHKLLGIKEEFTDDVSAIGESIKANNVSDFITFMLEI